MQKAYTCEKCEKKIKPKIKIHKFYIIFSYATKALALSIQLKKIFIHYITVIRFKHKDALE